MHLSDGYEASRLSASSPWKSQEYVALIQETIRGDPQFRPGPFRGVSEEGWSSLSVLPLAFADS